MGARPQGPNAALRVWLEALAEYVEVVVLPAAFEAAGLVASTEALGVATVGAMVVS